MHRKSLAVVALFAACLAPSFGQENEGWQKPAEQLQQATVTVRVTNPADPAATNEVGEPAGPQVSVCSGVFVAENLVITSVKAGSDSTIRLTLCGGGQATGKVKVVDEFSKLVLLETDQPAPGVLPLADKPPTVGAGVIAASAWGAEKAIVSLGIVGGVERSIPNLTTPQLLQCDLRTTDTSSGAGVIDKPGKLVGVIIAADHPETRRGWAYAVPASHVNRLLRARAEKSRDGSVIILTRRRPVVGVQLDGDERGIHIQRVTVGSPAEKAGLKVGDRVLATDGVQIRSVYQALLPTLHRQPGDTLRFTIERKSEKREVEVVLGGGVEVASAPSEVFGEVIRPMIDVQQKAKGQYAARSATNNVRELSVGDEEKTATATPMQAQKIGLLEKAVERYRGVIEFQQQEMQKRDADKRQRDQMIEMLQQELDRLKADLKAIKSAQE